MDLLPDWSVDLLFDWSADPLTDSSVNLLNNWSVDLLRDWSMEQLPHILDGGAFDWIGLEHALYQIDRRLVDMLRDRKHSGYNDQTRGRVQTSIAASNNPFLLHLL